MLSTVTNHQIVSNTQGNYLAACDDSGEVKIIDIEKNTVSKTLRRQHSNVKLYHECFLIFHLVMYNCKISSDKTNRKYAFEVIHHLRISVFTGGMDSIVIHWDFTKLKVIKQYEFCT